MLGRALRTTLVCDAGHPRNARAHAVHGFLTRDGIAPAELRAAARAELGRYETVTLLDGRVTDVKVLRSIPLLDAAAIDAVKQWTYTPTTLNGRSSAPHF